MPSLTKQLRSVCLSVSRISRVQKLFRFVSRGPVVLFYHGVEERIAVPDVQAAVQLPLSVFEKHMAFLRREREVISIDDLYESIVNGYRLDPNQVVLTFDDGYKNNLRIVAPLLRGWNLPFTVFVSTRHITEQRRFPLYYMRVATLYTEKRHLHLRSIAKSFLLTTKQLRLAAAERIVEIAKQAPLQLVQSIENECQEQLPSAKWAELNARFQSEQPMDWDDVRAVAAMGGIIGSHCHDHCILHDKQSSEEVRKQLQESKAEIEKNVGGVKFLAYPNGMARDISSAAYAAATSAQYQMAFTAIHGEVSADADRLLLPRICASPEHEEFCYQLNRSRKQHEHYRMVCSQFRKSAVLPGAWQNSGSGLS